MYLCLASLRVPEPGKAGRGAQLPQARLLVAGNVQGCLQMAFDFSCRSAPDTEYLGVKAMDLGAHIVLAVGHGVPLCGLEVVKCRLGLCFGVQI